MGEKIRVGPYRMPRERLSRALAAGSGKRGELVQRYKRFLRATPPRSDLSDPDESVRRVVSKTEVQGDPLRGTGQRTESLRGGRRLLGSEDLDDD